MVDARAEGGPSGTKVRQSIKDGDKDTFESMMPKELHKYFNKLKKHIS
jgi:predicted nucleotidyltransferase